MTGLVVDMQQLELLELPPRTDGKPTRIPRLRFRDQEGQHCLQLREWGVYELIRKNGLTYASSHAAENLRVELARRRYPQRQLADRLGVTAPWLNRRVHGQVSLNLDELAKIADALDMTVTELLGESA